MFFIAGSRTCRVRAGRMAEVCPACLLPRACRVRLLKTYSHLNFIPVSGFTAVAAELQCESCGHEFGRDANGIVTTKRKDATLDALIGLTNPDVVERAAALNEFLERAVAGALSEDERRGAIARCFAAVAIPLSRRADNAHVDWRSALRLIAGAAAVAIALAVCALVRVPPVLGWIMGVLVAAPWLMFLWSVHTDSQRYLYRRLLPGMVPQLLMLSPTEEDLRWVRRNLRQAKVSAHRAIKPKRFLIQLEDVRRRAEIQPFRAAAEMALPRAA